MTVRLDFFSQWYKYCTQLSLEINEGGHRDRSYKLYYLLGILSSPPLLWLSALGIYIFIPLTIGLAMWPMDGSRCNMYSVGDFKCAYISFQFVLMCSCPEPWEPLGGWWSFNRDPTVIDTLEQNWINPQPEAEAYELSTGQWLRKDVICVCQGALGGCSLCSIIPILADYYTIWTI